MTGEPRDWGDYEIVDTRTDGETLKMTLVPKGARWVYTEGGTLDLGIIREDPRLRWVPWRRLRSALLRLRSRSPYDFSCFEEASD